MSAPLKIGSWLARTIDAGSFWLDGGAMFGSVPKELWRKAIAADAENRIPLATRLLWLEPADGQSSAVLVDTGNGSKFDDRFRAMFLIDERGPESWGVDLERLRHLILTHLHFDHAGGATVRNADGTLAPAFPRAKVHLQRRNLENARKPWDRERASYLDENWRPLEDNAPLRLLEGDQEVLPGIRSSVINGHTDGLGWVLVGEGRGAVAFPSDLIPTSAHLHLPWIMGYDQCARTTFDEKRAFLEKAVDQKWVVVFEHDFNVPAATVKKNERGRFVVDEIVEF